MHHPRRNGHQRPQPVSHRAPETSMLMALAESLRHDVWENIGRLRTTQDQSIRLRTEFNERRERHALAAAADARFPMLM